MTTPEQERERIAGVYSRMTAEELRRVALGRAALTSIAQEALTAEIARRNLDLTSPEIDIYPEPREPEVSPPHSDEEYKRIAGVYSAKSDEELARLAATGFELSDEGHQALEAEISRRGLNLTLAPHPGFDVCELNDLVTLRKFRDLPEALMAKSSLESAGIESHLADDNMIRLDWFYSNLLGGIKLKVQPDDVDAANEILNQPIPETIKIEGVGEYEQPKCPACGSLDVTYQELNKFWSYGSAGLGVPVPVHKKAWTCHACRHEWVETDTENHAEPDAAGAQL